MKEETSGNMDYDKEQLFIKQLPTAVFIKNFIGGHPADCEEYLKDFVNSSKLVKEKGNEEFVLREHEKQSQGQADIYNAYYELDFKILVDTKYMEAKRMFSNSITELCPGVTSIGGAKLQGNETVFDIIKCFRDKTLKDLNDIESGISKNPENRVIKQTLNKISVDKNILFFLPYDYAFQKINTDLDSAKFISSCIASDLKGLLEYRKMKVDKDTFVTFVSNEYFIIAQEKNNTLIFYDMIKTSSSDLYSYLFNVGRL